MPPGDSVHRYAVICGQQEPCIPGNYSCCYFMRADGAFSSPIHSHAVISIPYAHSLITEV